MRLLFAIKSLNVHGGGAERTLVDVANGLVSLGHEIHVLTFDVPGRGFYDLDPRARRLDTGIGEPGRPTPRAGFVRAIPRIRGLVRSLQPDLTVVFMHSTYVPLSIALFGLGAKIIASEHVDAGHFQTRPVQRFLVRLVERMAVAKTVPSVPLRQEHDAAIRSKVHVVPNPVDVDAFASIASMPTSEPHKIVSIGRLMREKGHIELIRAFARLANEYPGWSLRIVGDGELRSELENEIARLDLESRVQLPGYTQDVATEYADANIVALPSHYESFGMVAAEALASGRPVLGFSDCLGLAEMIESGKNGLLVDSKPDRVTSLANGLETLMSDPQLRNRLAVAGPESVRRFARDDVVHAWESFLSGLLDAGH